MGVLRLFRQPVIDAEKSGYDVVDRSQTVREAGRPNRRLGIYYFGGWNENAPSRMTAKSVI